MTKRFSLRSWRKAQLRRQLQAQLLSMQTADYSQSAIVFAPHEDDETLGCGGTIIQKQRAGAAIHLVFMTDGQASHAHLISPQQLAEMRTQEAIAAAQTLGLPQSQVQFLGFPDGHLGSHQESAIAQVEQLLLKLQPQQIFIPYFREPDFIPDHRSTHQIVTTALRRTSLKVTVYEYPIWFWCHWPWMRLDWLQVGTIGRLKLGIKSLIRTVQQGWYPWKDFTVAVDISPVLSQKRRALACHKSQMEQLFEMPQWTTLAEVSEGDFLDCLLQPQEIFYRWESNKTR
ncbi:MAG: hypothetical protein B0A82_24365 [Alkalinema sp. CACIAM 70d]|nr:MAG: hypothetical protein B0A82_24365 [Alkalinema sp. CACIAM 70d]